MLFESNQVACTFRVNHKFSKLMDLRRDNGAFQVNSLVFTFLLINL